MAARNPDNETFAAFIRGNLEPILEDWVKFARTLLADSPDLTSLEDHARDILLAVAADMSAPQTPVEKDRKSKGLAGSRSDALTEAGTDHATQRHAGHLSVEDLIAEFRALRASVLRRWAQQAHGGVGRPEEISRFNEAIDEALTASISSYSEQYDVSRNMILGILAHDLRTPLQVASMSATLVARGDVAEPQLRQAAARILRSTSEMSVLIRDLLDYATARLGHGIPVTLAPLNLSEVCTTIVDQIQAAHPARRIHLRVEAGGAVNWDQFRIGQMLTNLLNNALNHGDGGEVSLSVGEVSDSVSMDVHNGGAPIPESKRAGLFEPLYQTAKMSSEKLREGSSGLGLGLYIACQIAQAHHGGIHVVSTEESGTHFIGTLPRDPTVRKK